MNEQRKVWVGLGAALLAGSAASAHAADTDPFNSHASHGTVQLAAAMGEGEGEGGEGEGEGGGAVDLTTNDAAYLGQLGLVRGHLWVGVQLYKAGHTDMALTHMKHPGDELYTGLKPALAARDEDGFAEALTALAEAVEQEQPTNVVERRYMALEKGIADAENLHTASLGTILMSIERMVRTAADEYAIGVKEGEIVNMHEYQDSYGFVEAAKARLKLLSDMQREESPEAVAEVKDQLNAVSGLWSGLAPDGNVKGDASKLYGAAARIQLAAWELE
ncbi:hypothetical protein [Marinimicrobium locisalis]|uniref:hypothetical protein n=1 Tax=Marinimicrobium locisalis TaxID=546022 RepID=UPI0032218608